MVHKCCSEWFCPQPPQCPSGAGWFPATGSRAAFIPGQGRSGWWTPAACPWGCSGGTAPVSRTCRDTRGPAPRGSKTSCKWRHCTLCTVYITLSLKWLSGDDVIHLHSTEIPLHTQVVFLGLSKWNFTETGSVTWKNIFFLFYYHPHGLACFVREDVPPGLQSFPFDIWFRKSKWKGAKDCSQVITLLDQRVSSDSNFKMTFKQEGYWPEDS